MGSIHGRRMSDLERGDCGPLVRLRADQALSWLDDRH
jgi:hypothetical protein